MQFRLSTFIWIVAVAAACLATWRYNAPYAPLVATFVAALFLVRESQSTKRSTVKLMRVGAISAGIGTFVYMIAVLSLDLYAVLAFPGTPVNASVLLRYVLVAVGFAILYAAIAGCLGASYGLVCAVALRIKNRDAIGHTSH